MSTFLIVVGVMLMIAAVVVVVLAFTRAKKAEKPGARQDPLKSGEMPVFGPKQLGPGAIVSYGGVDYVVHAAALHNLRQRSARMRFEPLSEAGCTWLAGKTGDGLDAARIVLPEAHQHARTSDRKSVV